MHICRSFFPCSSTQKNDPMKMTKQRWVLISCLSVAAGILGYLWLIKPTRVETGITLEKSLALRKGMSYDEVVAVIGCKPGKYNEFLKNTNPSLRKDKGSEFVLEDANYENISLRTDKYDHVYWTDFAGIQIKVMFTKDTRQLYRFDTYRYVPEENAFRYANASEEKLVSPDSKNADVFSEEEAVKIAVAHLKKQLSRYDGYTAEATMDDVTKAWRVHIRYKPARPGSFVTVTVDAATKQVVKVDGGE